MRIIAGKFKGRNLFTPKTITTRPTQGALRESVFNICQFEIENATFLDLFAGSGAMGFEALSRGASHVTFVESNKQAILTIKKNIELLGCASQVTLLQLDAILALERLVKPFDIIYVDPPYTMNVLSILTHICDRNLLKSDGTLFVEERYDPKKEEICFNKLFLKSSRKFGAAQLKVYIYRS